jgi:phage tail tube protein FII
MSSTAAQTPPEATNAITEATLNRLMRALGKHRGTQVAAEVLLAMGLRSLDSQADVLAFANRLIDRGGVVESVGRAIKISALLRGAV